MNEMLDTMHADAGKPVPEPWALTAPYWQAAADGRLLVQRCNACGTHQSYPRGHCTGCRSTDLAWRDAAGTGVVHTFTVIHRSGMPGFADEVPYVHAIVELAEGPRMSANLVGVDPATVTVGMPVRVVFHRASAQVAVPQFTEDTPR